MIDEFEEIKNMSDKELREELEMIIYSKIRDIENAWKLRKALRILYELILRIEMS